MDKIDQLVTPISGTSSGNVTSFRLDAGGAGVWIATTACLVMLGVMVVGGVIGAIWLGREFDRVDKELNERKEEGQRMQSYLSAIYVQAPQLKPAAEESKDDADR